jgi:hypothetical protein
MADFVIVAANVVPGAGAVLNMGTAGEALTAGQPVALDPASGKYVRADNDSATVALRSPKGICVVGANNNGPLVFQSAGEIALGTTLTPGAPVFVSATAGGLCPQADLTTGRTVQMVGLAKTAAILSMDLNPLGITI